MSSVLFSRFCHKCPRLRPCSYETATTCRAASVRISQLGHRHFHALTTARTDSHSDLYNRHHQQNQYFLTPAPRGYSANSITLLEQRDEKQEDDDNQSSQEDTPANEGNERETSASHIDNDDAIARILALAKANEAISTDKAARLLKEELRQHRKSMMDRVDIGNAKERQQRKRLRQKQQNYLMTACEAVLAALDRDAAAAAQPKAIALQAQGLLDDILSTATPDNNSHENRGSDIHDAPTPPFYFPPPSLMCYHHVLLAWSKVLSQPDQTERMFWDMFEQSQKTQPKLPDTAALTKKQIHVILHKSLNKVILTWAKAGQPSQCDQLFRKLLLAIPVPAARSAILTPTSYKLWLASWCVSGGDNAAKNRHLDHGNADDDNSTAQQQHFAKRAQAIVDTMVQRQKDTQLTEWYPDAQCWEWLIRAWTQAGVPQNAKGTLDRIIRQFTTAHANNNSDESQSQPPPEPFVVPTTAMFNHVLEAWVERQEKPFPTQQVMTQWLELCQRFPASNIGPPDLDSCHFVLRGFAQASSMHFRNVLNAEQFLRDMQEVQPKQQQPSSSSSASSQSANAAVSTLSLLPAPTVETYNWVLQAWRDSPYRKSLSRAEALYDEMHDHKSSNRDNPLAPNELTYTLMVETTLRHGPKTLTAKTTLQRARKIARQMKHYNVKPNARVEQALKECEDYVLGGGQGLLRYRMAANEGIGEGLGECDVDAGVAKHDEPQRTTSSSREGLAS